MPHGITQCCLPPGGGDIPALTPTEAGIRKGDEHPVSTPVWEWHHLPFLFRSAMTGKPRNHHGLTKQRASGMK